jgi:membrane-bound lytic murein transglycosylase B
MVAAGPLGAAEIPPAPAPDIVADPASFENFIREFRATAIATGISPEVYDRATTGISFNPRVQELNQQQPEFVRPIWEYLEGVITPQRIERGRDLMEEHAGLLRRLNAQYGVPPQILTAIWGIETNYGRSLGSFNMVEALANLAFAGPRAEYGRRELLAALRMAQQQHIDPASMSSSWAGAFGQTQFIPTTFLKYAVKDQGIGPIDLWDSVADALASTANYLQQSGWQAGEPWGEEVRLPDDFPYASADTAIRKPVSEWRQMGVQAMPGQELPSDDQMAAILLPAGHRGPAFMVFNNFNALLTYNSAVSYALAVGLLADRLIGLPHVQASWPVDEPALDPASATALQQGLTELGFPTGGTDGVFGPKTRDAIRLYQQSRGLPADGYATEALVERVLNETSITR